MTRTALSTYSYTRTLHITMLRLVYFVSLVNLWEISTQTGQNATRLDTRKPLVYHAVRSAGSLPPSKHLIAKKLEHMEASLASMI